MFSENYMQYLKNNYEDYLFSNISKEITSCVQCDKNNAFVYIPVDREIAFIAKRVMSREKLWIRGNIFHDLQSGIYIECPEVLAP